MDTDNLIYAKPKLSFPWSETLYDIITIIISITDVITDVLITAQFYHKHQRTFLIIAICIFSIAYLGYIFLIISRFGVVAQHERTSRSRRLLSAFLLGVLLGPFTPLILFFHSRFPKYAKPILKCLNLQPDIKFSYTYSRASQSENRLMRWFGDQINAHLGFIVEACLEAFPQSMLQMCAMIVTKKASWLSILSILMSILSVASKLVSYAISQHWEATFFSWFSFIFDLFLIFASLSWVFYSPSSTSWTDTLGKCYLYMSICSAAVPFLISLGLSINFAYVITFNTQPHGFYSTIARILSAILIAPFLFALMLVGFTLICHICVLTYVARAMMWLYRSRLTSLEETWTNIVKWILSSSNWNDYRLRIAIVNLFFVKNIETIIGDNSHHLSQARRLYDTHSDDFLNIKAYCQEQITTATRAHKVPRISLRELRRSVSNVVTFKYFQNPYRLYMMEYHRNKQRFETAKNACNRWEMFTIALDTFWGTCMCVACVPYFFTRIFVLFYPFIAFVYNFKTIFRRSADEVELLCITLTFCAFVILCFVVGLSYRALTIHYTYAHLVPVLSKLVLYHPTGDKATIDTESVSFLENAVQYYVGIELGREYYRELCDFFGNDIGGEVWSFFPPVITPGAMCDLDAGGDGDEEDEEDESLEEEMRNTHSESSDSGDDSGSRMLLNSG